MNHTLTAKATVTVRHDRAYDFDEDRGIWLYRRGEDEKANNILTNVGRVTLHTFIYGNSAQRAAASLGTGMHFIGLSDDSAPPVAGDTALAGELTGSGLGRVEGSVTLPTGSGTITSIQNEFTYTGGAPQGVQKTALFDAASAGNMCHEILFTQRSLAVNDTLTLTFNITLT